MMIACPKCSQHYPLNHIVIGSQGRRVRCGVCDEVWLQKPILPENREEKILPPIVNVDLLKKNTRSFLNGLTSVKRKFLKTLKTSLITLLFLGAIGAGIAWFFQEGSLIQNIRLWAIQIYRQNAAEVKPKGIEIHYVYVEPEENVWSKVEKFVKVKGDVINNSSHSQALPSLKIYLRGKCGKKSASEEGCVLEKWVYPLAQTKLLPGEVIHFEISLKPKQSQTGHYSVGF